MQNRKDFDRLLDCSISVIHENEFNEKYTFSEENSDNINEIECATS